MPTVREYEAAIQRNAADTEAFVALRKAYRQAQRHDRLVVLYEARAQAIEDHAKASELFYLAAELRLDQLGDPAGAEADLVNAVDRDPTHIRAAARLKDIYREQGRTADYMTMLEMEAAAVARTRDPARLAELEAEMSQLFQTHFAPLERAIRSPHHQNKLAQEQVRTIESARKIYRALGDYRAVVRLYELELEGTTDARRRADLLLGLGRVLSEKLEELDAAAQRLSEVVRLRPRDERALELLAGVYANPNWIGGDGAARAAGFYHQIARRRQEAGDVENAIAALRKALQAVPGHTESSDLLERVYYDAERYHELDRYYRERISAAATEDERIDFLYKRAQLSEGELGDPAEAIRVYDQISTMEPPEGPAAEKLVELYTSSRAYAKLAELRERQLGAIAEPPARARLMLELAALYRDRLGDHDQAAVYLHAVLEIDPENQAALAAYAEHFREKSDWGALADLLEFAYERMRVAGGSPEQLLPRLEEIAAVAEKQLGDVERAIAAWERAEEISPTYTRARESQRRLLLKLKSWDRLAALLEREAAAQADVGATMEILRRVAQIHRDKLGNAARAIEVYRQILNVDPADGVSMRAAVEIYEREGDFVSLAQLLREQIDRTQSKQERVGLLRRVLVICDEQTGDLAQGKWAATQILEAVPGDRDVLTRLEGILERANAPAELVAVLDQHSQHATNPDEKVQILHRIAEITAGPLRDPAAAARRLEEIAAIRPEDVKGLDSLAHIYSSLGRHQDLARVLEMQIERAISDPAQQAEHLRQLGRLASGPLADLGRARDAWEQLLAILPTDAEALEAVARICTAEEDWPALVRVLDRQIPLAADATQAVQLALTRAQVLDERLRDVDAAAAALEQVIAEIDPRSVEAHERLRRYYQRAESWSSVVRIAERQLTLLDDREARVAHAMELAALIRDRLGDEQKAIGVYERVLELAPDNLDALRSVTALYLRVGDHRRLVFADEKLLESTVDVGERRRLQLEIASLHETHLADPRRAFDWYRRAYLESPDAESLQRVDDAARRHGLYEELIQIYEGARARATEPAAATAALLNVAAICEEKLDDPGRAFATIVDALSVDPTGRDLLPNLERLASVTGNWEGLLDVYARVARSRTQPGERVELLRLRASVREQRLGDPSGALDEMLRSFALAPDDPSTHDEILRLARATGRWEDAIAVQGQLFALANDLARKLDIARNAAHLVEHEVKDLVRAFRAYLNAFHLAPDDEQIVAHLWRLASRIGRYAPEILTPESPASTGDGTKDDGSPGDGSRGDGSTAEAVTASGPAASAQERADKAADESADERAAARDAEPLPHDEDAVASMQAPAAVPGAGEDSARDRSEGAPEAAAAPAGGGDEAIEEMDSDLLEDGSGAHPAPQPEPTPEIRRSRPPAPPPAAAAAPAPEPPRFTTPWQELAAAYEALPAEDSETRWVYLRKIAEVWERGEKDIERAMEALERAFRLDTRDEDVRRELERIGSEYDQWDRVASIYLGAIDELGSVETAVALRHEVARLRERLGHVEKVEELYQDILRVKSDDPVALARLEQICRDQERWEDLANVIERRTNGPTEVLPPGRERRDRLRELAALYEQRLERPYEAIDTLERLRSELIQQEQLDAYAGDEDELPGAGVAAPEDSEGTGGDGHLQTDADDDHHPPEVVDESDAGAEAESQSELESGVHADEDQAAELHGDEPVTLELGASPPPAAPDPEEMLEAEEALFRLYSRVGLWVKAVESLNKQAAAVSDPQHARALRLQMATIYEKELASYDRAIEAYEAIVAEIPDDAEALAALDRLNEAQGRYEDLEDVLRRRAALARGRERLELSRRRARILEDRLNNPEGAAGALRELGAAAIADDELLASLLKNLRRAGLAHEAARALKQRIEIERKRKGQSGPDFEKIAELSLELATLRLDDLNDPAGARRAVDTALAAVPESPGALAALAQLHLRANDFAGYAATRVRVAHTMRGRPEATAALVDAGRVYREQLGDLAKAEACFQQALADDPDDAHALRALASLLSAEGQWSEAQRLLTRQLDATEDPEIRAAVLTDLARTVWDGNGDAVEAQRYLDEALMLEPDHLPAILASADVYYKEGQWEHAERRLADAVRRLRGEPQAAKLFQRLAEVYDRLARTDDAYRQLVEADRLEPGQLQTKLALGENRFRAGRWREAAAHLGGLAEHPEVAVYREEVAEALTHAAQAEVKLRHPERAIEIYESSLTLRGQHLPTLRALAELSQERGENEKAAGYLRRVAEQSTEPSDRTQCLERLGDIELALGRPDAALRAYEEALAAGGAAGESQLALLEKMLKLERSTGDDEGAGRTCTLLVELTTDPLARAARRREAAAVLAEIGKAGEAASLLEQALTEDPQDEAALVALCDMADRLPAGFGLPERLARVLEALPPPAPNGAARTRRARLWQRHADSIRNHDPSGAIAAYEHVVGFDPADLPAREALADLYAGHPEHDTAAAENHRHLLAADIPRVGSLRALAAIYERRGLADAARCCLEMLSVFGAASPDEQEFLDAHPPAEMKPDDPYPATIDEQDRRDHLALPEATVMAEIFSCLWDGAPGLVGQKLDDFGVSAPDKISPIGDLDLGKIYGQVAKALGNKKVALYVKPEGGGRDTTIVVQAPPALVVGHRVANDASPTEVRFLLARGIELTRPEYILAAGVRPKQFTSLFSTVLKAFHPRHARRRTSAADALAEQAAKLKKNVPYKVSKQLVELFQALGNTPWSSLRWRAVVHHVGNRTGLLLCGDLRTAAQIVLRDGGAIEGGADADATSDDIRRLANQHEPLRELLQFAISEDYFLLRERLGTAVAKAAAA